MYFDTLTLEFHKIVALIKNEAQSAYAKVLLDELMPTSIFEDVVIKNLETDKTRTLIIKYQDLPFGGLNDILGLIKKLRLDPVLSAKELLDIINLLYCTSNVCNYFKEIENQEDISVLKGYIDNLNILKPLTKAIYEVIDDNGVIIDTASNTLFNIRKNIKNLTSDAKKKMLDIINQKSSMLT